MTSILPLPSMAPSTRAPIDPHSPAAASSGDRSAADRRPRSAASDGGNALSSSSAAVLVDGSDMSDMSDKVGSLIDAQVDAGSLTGGQATELKSFFAQGPGDAAQSGGPRGPGGSPPPPAMPAAATSSGTDAASPAPSIEDQLKTLGAMLDSLRQGLSNPRTHTYGGGTVSTTPTGLVYHSIA